MAVIEQPSSPQADSLEAVAAEARRQSQKWWAQQQGKSVDEILATLSKSGGGRPNPVMLGRLDPEVQALVAKANLSDQLRNYAQQQRGLIGNQFGRPGLPIMADPHYGLAIAGLEDAPNALAPAFANPHRTAALASEMQRLSEIYPHTPSRMQGLTVGRGSNAEGWNTLGWPTSQDAPGAVPYTMGTPAEAALIRDPSRVGTFNPITNRPNDRFPYLSSDESLYPQMFERTGSHEFGHAVQGSMDDFAKSLSPDSLAKAKYGRLLNELGLGDQNYISQYADIGRLQKTGTRGVSRVSDAAAEPFAELFSSARSPQGIDLLKGNKSALKEVIGKRSGSDAIKMADRVGQLNDAEKALRNEGFNEVGKAGTGMLTSIAAPIALGLAASKTHGTAQKVLGGAAAGAGLGGFFGPEGTLIGGLAGGGLSLAKQLIG